MVKLATIHRIFQFYAESCKFEGFSLSKPLLVFPIKGVSFVVEIFNPILREQDSSTSAALIIRSNVVIYQAFFDVVEISILTGEETSRGGQTVDERPLGMRYTAENKRHQQHAELSAEETPITQELADTLCLGELAVQERSDLQFFPHSHFRE